VAVPDVTELPSLSGRVDPGRSRAGNAMARTRAAVLAGARSCVQKSGSRRTTMVEVAAAAGVAKATLYNHFRTKSEVLVALVEAEVAGGAAEAAEVAQVAGLPTALLRLAERIGEHPVVRRLAATEPAVVASLVLPSAPPQPAWEIAREGLRSLLTPVTAPAELPLAVEAVLRWLVSQLLWPGSREETAYAVALLLRREPQSAAVGGGDVDIAVPARETEIVPVEVPVEQETVATEPDAAAPGRVRTVPGLGYPGVPARIGEELVTVGPAPA
jgi:AcrR family transcriptional regulator